MDKRFDPTGFPLLSVPGQRFFLHLLPVTKVQFEEWLTHSDTPGDLLYDQAQIIRPRIEAARRTRLGIGSVDGLGSGAQIPGAVNNERISWRHCDDRNYERLLMTGLKPEEALEFAHWMGPEYDLPTVSEWRTTANCWANRSPLLPGSQSTLAENVWHKLFEIVQPQTLLDQSLMASGGVMEWVWDDKKQKILWLGSPRPKFFGNTFRPVAHDPPPPRATGKRLWFCGFRLIWRN